MHLYNLKYFKTHFGFYDILSISNIFGFQALVALLKPTGSFINFINVSKF